MKRLTWIILIGLIAAGSSFAQIRWQTTREGDLSGNCRIRSNKFRLIVHPLHVDIEEEAEITTVGDVLWGDSRTLEIVNEFSVSPGTAIRSMLLWNGDQILKSKLKLKEDANKEYEDVVDRQQVQQFARDPAIIEYIGKNRYRCRIYPVAAGATRKIRILYSVPLRLVDGVPCFEISTIFTVGASEHPGQIPVQIVKSDDAFAKYALKNNSSRKSITFGSVYIQSYSDIIKNDPYGWFNPTMSLITIIPDVINWDNAWTSHVVSAGDQEYYTAIVASVPQAVSKLLNEQNNPSDIKLQVGITIGKKSYLADISETGYWTVYSKSDSLWNGSIHWTGYDQDGESAFVYEQKITAQSSASIDSILPLLWGARYSLDEGNGNTGALFGFVDPVMSLLALESDTIGAAQSFIWNEEGVPLLLNNEIIINSQKLPKTPKESIFFGFSSPMISSMSTQANLCIIVDNDGFLRITLPEGLNESMSIRVLDVAGRVVHEWKSIEFAGALFSAKLPERLSGFYVVQIRMGNNTIQKKIVVR